MKAIAGVSIVAACALGAGVAMAQSVERGGKVVSKPATQTVAQASSAAPIQTAQAGAAGGAAGGASTGGVLGGVGTAGTVGSTVVFVGAAVASVAAASDTNPTVQH